MVEKDQQSTHQTTKEADSQGETRESEEKSLDKTTVYSQGTDGTQIPYVSKENAPEVEGHSCNSRWRWECSCCEESDRSGAGIIWCRSA